MIDQLRTPQLALALGGHLGEDVTFVSALALDAGTRLLETFLGASMNFLLGHGFALRIYGYPLFFKYRWAHTINKMKQLPAPVHYGSYPVTGWERLLLLFLYRRQDHGYLPTFHLGFLVDSAILREIFPDALHHLGA